jgi:4-amino-4-deoxy-L-arabinose transferase-like glycosyltransferase
MFFNLTSYKKFSDYLNDKKNFYKVFFVLVFLLSVLKLPPVFTTDIQPWDEGMYATRVLSIEKFGDFFDQTSHSVGKYYSSTHPPLLIWTGYFASKIFGLNAVTLKLIPYLFALLCLLFIMKLGSLIHSTEIGFYAAVIFSSNIIFNIFSKRFQFDIPYTFFAILSFYYFIKALDSENRKYIYLSGIAAGLCMLSKLLVGIIVPMVLFASYFFIGKDSKFSFKDCLIITGIALLMSVPWYIYLIGNNGKEAIDYILNFHLYQRATVGVEQNAKGTGVFYFANYILTIIPFGFLVFYALFLNLKKFRNLNWKIKFVSIWFMIAFIIVTSFKTKLESYSFLFLPAACILIGYMILQLNSFSKRQKTIVLSLAVLNFLWYFSEHYRNNLKDFLAGSIVHKMEVAAIIIAVFLISVIIIKQIIQRVNLSGLFSTMILAGFAISNIFYLMNIPYWENGYKITDVKKIIDGEKDKSVLYIASNYRHNPQLTFYFNGVDLGWKDTGYNFNMLDTKNGLDSIRAILQNTGRTFLIVEKDNINRAEYPASELFVPDNFKLVSKVSGYELYKNF